MTLTLSDHAKSAATRQLSALGNILTKAEAHAAETEIDEAVLLGWRLAPNMFPMSRQVQIASDISCRGLARLAGAEVPSMPDEEKSFAELKERVARASAVIEGLDEAALDADPEGMIEFPAGGAPMSLPRQDYALQFVLPNLYFHVSTAYGLLRAGGVALGKRDFLGG